MLDTTTRALDKLLVGAQDAPPSDVYMAARFMREDANQIQDHVSVEDAEFLHLVANFLGELCVERDLVPPSDQAREDGR